MTGRFAHALFLILFSSFLVTSAFSAMSQDPTSQIPAQRPARHASLPGAGPSTPEAGVVRGDTVQLIGPLGSGAVVNGQFQDVHGFPAWNGWTTHDLTSPEGLHWHISGYGQEEGDLALYCGDETLPSCDQDDPVGGYGNSWQDVIEYRYQVADPGSACLMTVSGVISHDTEPGYDFTSLTFVTAGGDVDIAVLDGIGLEVPFSHTFLYTTADYVGPEQDQVLFQVEFRSDGAWSDEDCLHPTAGACRMDDLLVECSNGSFSAFNDFDDGQLGGWQTESFQGVGDFTGLWTGLEDVDPCQTNYSPQVAFIDDGTQVPGAGPSECINWCYGPGGYIVNTTGGAAEYDDPYLWNSVRSPAIAWPGEQYDGCLFSFDVYRHEDLSADSPGIFYTWDIRSASDPDELNLAHWKDRGFIYFGGPGYLRESSVVSDLLEPDVSVVQVRMTCYELGWVWGYVGDDGYPAPYFDNVSLQAFTIDGPGFSTRAIDQAQDNFPASGVLDLENLAANSVRFDMASPKRGAWAGHNIPGDSVTCDIVPLRDGAELTQKRLYYTMRRNPVFDAVRDPAWGPSGYVEGRQSYHSSGVPIPGEFAFDLPDSGFLFPGDILHYYFQATEEVFGQAPRTGTYPADLAGYGNFDAPTLYDPRFVMRALPTVESDGYTPDFLFWDDSSGHDHANTWFWTLRYLGFEEGIHYDRYATKGATSEVGNGLGGRCTVDLLSEYGALFYTCGDLSSGTLGNGDVDVSPSPDLPLLNAWDQQGGARMLLMGDGLASSLQWEGSLAGEFLSETMNVSPVAFDIRPLIGNQFSPRVVPLPAGQPVFFTTPSWILDGGCPTINTFDAVLPGAGATQLATYTNPAGQPDYLYSAATLNVTPFGSEVISLPFGLSAVSDDPATPLDGGHHRKYLLADILSYFWLDGFLYPVAVPEAAGFQVANHPNPFNPTTRIEYNLPRDGRLEIRVFDLRGQLVTTLVDEERPAGPGHVMWNGSDSRGAPVGSGVYFYEARTAGEVRVEKMTLLK